MSASVNRDVARPARSVCRIAHVFGIDSASTKMTTVLTTAPIAGAPAPPRRLTNSTVVSVTCTVCSAVTVTSSGLMNRSGCSTSRSSARLAFDSASRRSPGP